jgi:hypothetical protein
LSCLKSTLVQVVEVLDCSTEQGDTCGCEFISINML